MCASFWVISAHVFGQSGFEFALSQQCTGAVFVGPTCMCTVKTHCSVAENTANWFSVLTTILCMSVDSSKCDTILDTIIHLIKITAIFCTHLILRFTVHRIDVFFKHTMYVVDV